LPEIHLDEDLEKKVEGMGKGGYGKPIFSLKYTQSSTACDLCETFIEMMHKMRNAHPCFEQGLPGAI
jgi:hypothetical protein